MTVTDRTDATDAEFATVLHRIEAAPEVDIDADVAATGPWRVGEHYGIHVYEGDRPVATFHRPEDAARAVAAVTAQPPDGGDVR